MAKLIKQRGFKEVKIGCQIDFSAGPFMEAHWIQPFSQMGFHKQNGVMFSNLLGTFQARFQTKHEKGNIMHPIQMKLKIQIEIKCASKKKWTH